MVNLVKRGLRLLDRFVTPRQFMTGQISDDGQHMWNGTEWIPNPAVGAPAAAAMPAQAAAQPMPMAAAGAPVAVQGEQKDFLIALILSILVGAFGIDRFYMGYIGLGVLKLLTLGGCGIWWLIDLILIVMGNLNDANGMPLKR